MKFKNFRYYYLILLIIILSSSYTTIAQNETNNWYFGDFAGIDFNNGGLTLLNDSSMSTPFGCSSMSDSNGDLLFYSNGETVWNKNHEVMTNGTGLNAEITNNQTSLITPDPTDDNAFFILTTKTEDPYPGIYYSKVVFNTANPLGEVTAKNVRVTSSATERISAVHSPETNSIKVVGLGKANPISDEEYNAIHVINIGIFGSFPTSNPNLVNTVFTNESFNTKDSVIKFSPNGDYIVIGDNGSFSRVLLYAFDNATNNVTHIQTINAGYILTPIPIEGLEFSADSEIIYFSGNLGSTAYLHKYIINSTSTLNEKILIDTSQDYRFGALQLASNSKIYMANYTEESPYFLNKLSVINYPEEIENIEYEAQRITFNGSHSTKGLPNFVTSFFRNRIISENKCVTEELSFSLDAFENITSATWNFDDGTTASGLNPTHSYTTPGNYNVSAVITVGSKQIELYKEVIAYPIPNIIDNTTIIQCDVDNDGISNFNLNLINGYLENNLSTQQNELHFFTSENDAINDTDEITNPEYFENTVNPQQIFVKIITEKGCESIDSFTLQVQSQSLEIVTPFIVCENSDGEPNNNIGQFDLSEKIDEISTQFGITDTETIRFYATLEDALADHERVSYTYHSTNSTLWLKILNSNNECGTIAAMDLIVNPTIQLEIEDSYQLCELQPNPVLDGNISNNSWEWTNNSGVVLSTQRFFQPSTPGVYNITVSKEQNGIDCSITKQFTVLDINTPEFGDIDINGKNLTVNIDGNSDYEYSLNNIDFFGQGNSHTFIDVSPGIINVYVRDKDNCEKPIDTEVSFIYFSRFFTPNGDNFNDYWKVYGINSNLYNSAEILIFDRYGKKLYSMNLLTINYGWDGSINDNYLPNSDYWFKAYLVDKDNNIIEKIGHFSLIR